MSRRDFPSRHWRDDSSQSPVKGEEVKFLIDGKLEDVGNDEPFKGEEETVKVLY